MTAVLRAIAVDDEPLAIRRLQIALERIGGIDLLGDASEGATALRLIRNLSPDLVFLDIKMPLMDGFALSNALLSAPIVPEIVFVTAYSDFAVRAFEVGAVGYVLKPIGESQLRTAIDAARVKLRTRNAQERLADLTKTLEKLQFAQPPPEPQFETEFWIDSGSTLERVATGTIDWFEAAGDYVAVHCDQKEHLLYDSLASLAQRLNPDEFTRVHRKAIVRIQSIRALERGKFGAITLQLLSGDRVPVSRSHKRELLSRFGTR